MTRTDSMGSVMRESECAGSDDVEPGPTVGTEGALNRVDLNVLYRAERGALLWYLRSQGVGQHEAEDAIQAAFVRLLQAKEHIREPRWWLRTVALNEYRRSCPSVPHSRRRTIVVPMAPTELPDRSAATALSDPAVLGEPQWAHDAIARLPDKQRQVMASHVEGRSNQQIADQLSMSNPTVRQNLRRARRALSKQLLRNTDD